MSSEPNHPMDRALNAYAARRRQDAGAPLELHPATRRMLHDAIARNAPCARGTTPSWTQLCAVWWPRLAGVAVLCAVLGLVARALFQPDSLRREHTLAQMSRDELLPNEAIQPATAAVEIQPTATPLASAAATAPAAPIVPTRPGAASAPEADAFSKSVTLAEAGAPRPDSPRHDALNLAATARENTSLARGAAFGGGEGLRDVKDAGVKESIAENKRRTPALESSRRLADSAAAPPQELLAVAKTEDAMARTKLAPTQRTESLAVRFAAVPPPAVAEPTAPEPAAGLTMMPERRTRGAIATAGAMEPTQAQNFYFRQRVTPTETRGALQKKAAEANVLTSFSWQQTGRQLRVVDADGSVYLGQTIEAGAPGQESSPVAQGGEQPTATLGRQNLTTATFRVSGTNQTLRQSIVITGQLLRESELAAARYYAFDKAQPAPKPTGTARNRSAQQPAATPTAGWPTNAAQPAGDLLRIEAQATLGDGQVLPIRAVNR